jgi:hypothetical protein
VFQNSFVSNVKCVENAHFECVKDKSLTLPHCYSGASTEGGMDAACVQFGSGGGKNSAVKGGNVLRG